MLKKIEVDKLMDMAPYLIYQRVNLIANAPGKFYFPIEPGYWYWLRQIRCKWNEVDAAGVVYNPGMFIEMRGSSRHRTYQDAPIPLRLISSPGGNGVNQVLPNLMTATGPASFKMIDEILPQRDNIEIYLTGHNVTPFPAFIDVLLVGYMIPDKSMVQFKGVN